jgi:carbon-monoxide dehydrogenase large subunit
VIGEDELSAQEALDKIKVDYEELTPVLDVKTALAPGAVLVHGTEYLGGAFRGFDDFTDFPGSTKNICQDVHVEWGDVDAAFASAAHIVEGEF